MSIGERQQGITHNGRVLAAAWGFNERPADTSTEAQ